MYPNPAQLRAARALLNLKQSDVARRASLSERTVIAAEKGKTGQSTLGAIMAAYMALGIRFEGTTDGSRIVVIYEAASVFSDEPVDPLAVA